MEAEVAYSAIPAAPDHACPHPGDARESVTLDGVHDGAVDRGVMDIANLDDRLRRLASALELLLAGDFEALGDLSRVADDPLGRIEETVELLVLDIKTVTIANREKEASLLLQQEQLV